MTLSFRCGIKAQIATVEEKLIIKVIGSIQKVDQQAIDGRLRH